MTDSTTKSEGSVSIEHKHALVLLAKEIFAQINEVAYLKKHGHKADLSLHLLREMSSVLQELSPALTEAYYKILLSIADKASTPFVPSNDNDFIEATIAAKKRLIHTIRQDLAAN